MAEGPTTACIGRRFAPPLMLSVRHLMAGNTDQFNAHQQDMRNRAIILVKIILLVAGGALSISIGVFTNTGSPSLSAFSVHALQGSWICLFGTILLLITSMVVIIARDYCFGERWRRVLHDQTNEAKEVIVWVEYLIWGTAIVGYICFLAGMLGLTVVAYSVVGQA